MTQIYTEMRKAEMKYEEMMEVKTKSPELKKAIFWDRDGVLLKLVFHKEFGEVGPAFNIPEIEFFEDVFHTLNKIKIFGYSFFLVSNQPDFAKGRTSLENLKSVHIEFDRILKENKVFFEDYYYCYHHPLGITEGYNIKCDCRKPGNANVENAISRYNIDRQNSVFIGDRDKDIECGKKSGLKTILVNSKQTNLEELKEKPDFMVDRIQDLLNIIELWN